MSNSLSRFLGRATQKAAEDLIAAIENLPADKRAWSPMGGARTALDVAAECAILSDPGDLLRTRVWKEEAFANYQTQKAELVAQGWETIKSQLNETVARGVKAIEEVPEADLQQEVAAPWGPMTVEQIMSYPYWNMCYHEGQVNYIAAMLEQQV